MGSVRNSSQAWLKLSPDYEQARAKEDSLDRLVEWPAQRDLLGDVSGRSVLDVGCGNGAKLAELVGDGATASVGVDISGNLDMACNYINNVERIEANSIISKGNSLVIRSNVDMDCGNIYNMQAVFVDQMFGKNSPINVEDTLIIQDNGTDTATIQFANGIRISHENKK